MALTFNIDGSDRSGVIDLRFSSGTSKNANPQRPTMALGSGRLTVTGYRTSMRKKLIVNQGSQKLLEGWVQNESYDEITGFSTYEIEGLLKQAARSNQMISQSNASANANQDAVINLMRDAFGVSSIESSLASTPLSMYSFNGSAGGYASRFGLVSGGLPYETNVGVLGIKSPFRVPTTLDGTFSERDYRIRQIITEFDQEQLWNAAVVPFTDRGGTVSQSAQAVASWPATGTGRFSANGTGAAADTRNAGVNLGAPPANSRYANVTAGGSRLQAIVLSNGAVRGVFSRPLSSQAVTNGNASLSADTNGVTVSVTATGWTGGNPGRWGRGNLAADSWAQYYDDVGEVLGITAIQALVSISYDVITSDVQRNIDVFNNDSIMEWDERKLSFPVWFSPTAASAVQARIDRLAVPRNIHTIDFYLDQRDATKDAEIAALQPGMYIAVPHVGSIVYIMHSAINWSASGSGIKRLTCIDTGTAHVPTVPSHALSWRNNPLTWRGNDNYLTWRQPA